MENCEAIDEVNCEAYHVSKPEGSSEANGELRSNCIATVKHITKTFENRQN